MTPSLKQASIRLCDVKNIWKIETKQDETSFTESWDPFQIITCITKNNNNDNDNYNHKHYHEYQRLNKRWEQTKFNV